MNSKHYWIWLQTALGAGVKTDEIISFFGSPQAFYDAGENQWRNSLFFSNAQIQRLLSTKLSKSEEIVKSCDEKGYTIVTPDDAEYPNRLRVLPNYPAALYIWGELPPVDSTLCISIVGTREASYYGKRISHQIAHDLAKAGAVVVSGGALGIDTAAHKGAIAAGGKTVCVLGCGLAYPYLRVNETLREAVSKNGAVVSEYPPESGAGKHTFPIRNRIISALSLGVVVIEAGSKSGSLITVNHALDQGKDVFVVPGDITQANNRGINGLLRDGMTPVFSAVDILQEYKEEYGDRLNIKIDNIPYNIENYAPLNKELESIQNKKEIIRDKNITRINNNINKKIPGDDTAKRKVYKKPSLPPETGVNTVRIYDCFSPEKELHVDEIARISGLPPKDVLCALTELEILGAVQMMAGRRYKLTDEQD